MYSARASDPNGHMRWAARTAVAARLEVPPGDGERRDPAATLRVGQPVECEFRCIGEPGRSARGTTLSTRFPWPAPLVGAEAHSMHRRSGAVAWKTIRGNPGLTNPPMTLKLSAERMYPQDTLRPTEWGMGADEVRHPEVGVRDQRASRSGIGDCRGGGGFFLM